MSPLAVALLFTLVCAAMFVAGLNFFRTAEPPAGTTVEQARRFGRLLMMAGTAMLLFLIAVIVRGDFKLEAAQ